MSKKVLHNISMTSCHNFIFHFKWKENKKFDNLIYIMHGDKNVHVKGDKFNYNIARTSPI